MFFALSIVIHTFSGVVSVLLECGGLNVCLSGCNWESFGKVRIVVLSGNVVVM